MYGTRDKKRRNGRKGGSAENVKLSAVARATATTKHERGRWVRWWTEGWHEGEPAVPAQGGHEGVARPDAAADLARMGKVDAQQYAYVRFTAEDGTYIIKTRNDVHLTKFMEVSQNSVYYQPMSPQDFKKLNDTFLEIEENIEVNGHTWELTRGTSQRFPDPERLRAQKERQHAEIQEHQRSEQLARDLQHEDDMKALQSTRQTRESTSFQISGPPSSFSKGANTQDARRPSVSEWTTVGNDASTPGPMKRRMDVSIRLPINTPSTASEPMQASEPIHIEDTDEEREEVPIAEPAAKKEKLDSMGAKERAKQAVLVYPREGVNLVTIHEEDMERLQEGEFLNDTLIEFYIRWATITYSAARTDVHMFNTFFYQQLTAKGDNQK
ncbi:hypothetical protein BC830DRAFT_685605 [Chytriomyces sp. MP71]|nr:hypothetical protein BC830DRAFT_685605 [Chytriomyces sp. MP71]